MASIQNNSRLFGIDIRHLGRDLCRVCQDLQYSPLLSWLAPDPLVSLLQVDGKSSTWQMGSTPGLRSLVAGEASRFSAVEVPQEMFLQREIKLPALAEDQMLAALLLEVQSVSPFAVDDLAWGYRAVEVGEGQVRVVAVISSLKQLQAHLTLIAAPSTSEVWALLDNRRQPVVFAGFGERRRLQYVATKRRWGLALFLFALLLLAAIALTPTVQQHLRTREAVARHDELVRDAEPTVRKREALLKATDELKVLSDELGNRIDPLRLIEILTQSLPDDTTVHNLKLQSAKVTISGVTANASTLMQLLGALPGLRDVRAPSAATRTPGSTRESFVIEFTLDPRSFAIVMSPPEPMAADPSASAAMPAVTAPVAQAAPVVTVPSVGPVQAAKPVGTFGGSSPARPAAPPPSAASSHSGAKP